MRCVRVRKTPRAAIARAWPNTDVDDDEVEELSLNFQVESIPTFVFFSKTESQKLVQGADKAKIQQIYEANK